MWLIEALLRQIRKFLTSYNAKGAPVIWRLIRTAWLAKWESFGWS